MGGSIFIPALGGLRGLAALSVVAAHLAENGYIPAFPFYGGGAAGVMLFFTLSGFLMAHKYLPDTANRAAVARFARARFARVYPLYALTIVASSVLTAAGVDLLYPLATEAVLPHLAFIRGDRVFWTISVEFQFYAVFALFWFVTRGVLTCGDRTVVLLLLTTYLALWLTGAPGGHLSLVRNGHVFIAGMLGALALRNLETGRLARATLVVSIAMLPLVWAGPLLLWGIDQERVYRSMPLHAAMALLVWSAVAARGSAVQGLLSARPMLALGDWSFGIYLLHIPIIWTGSRLAFVLGVDRVWLIVPVLVCIVVVARRSFLSIETPLRKLITQRDRQQLAPA